MREKERKERRERAKRATKSITHKLREEGTREKDRLKSEKKQVDV